MTYEYWIIILTIGTLLYALWRFFELKRQPVASPKAQEIANAIREGAMAFLHREYRVLAIFVILASIALWVLGFLSTTGSIDNRTIVTFVIGAILSALAGNIGMRVATIANVRTAEAVSKSVTAGLKVAFTAGTVAGLSVVGLVVLGLTILWLIWPEPELLFGFGFGASAVGLFARVGGGIYTKAADVGGDLVGKIEKGIPEDDPRNPATIADSVGDNVGDIAGMGADLFETYVDILVAAMALGLATHITTGNLSAIYPLLVATLGILASLIGSFFVRSQSEDKIAAAMTRGILVSGLIVLAGTWWLTDYFFGNLNLFWAVLIGLVAGLAIGLLTEYYTSNQKAPARRIAEAAATGAGTNLIAGFATGMLSTASLVLVISAAILLSFQVAGMYGVAMAAVGMLSILGLVLAADVYGPIADNAAAITEMSGMGPEVRQRAEALDAVGNTTAAIGKGFAVGSAVLAAVALLASYATLTNLTTINVIQPTVLVGLFLGAMLPFFLAAQLTQAVGKSAMKMVNEVRRQFREIKGLMEGTAKPDYYRCVDIATSDAIQKMIMPSLIAIASPLVIGFTLGAEALGGLLAGAIVTGFLLAVTMANAGGAWDNAKKYIEAGNLGGKGSDTHKAAVVGDTVGDPFKDTAGPAVNVLIKLISIIALVIAPLL
jgi:K(+)-stimulated pyrophosphate-energized sodium pump